MGNRKEETIKHLSTRIDQHSIDHVDFGDWQFNRGPELAVQKDEGLLPSQEMLDRFAREYSPRPGYSNWMYDNLGVPSPIIRVDFSPEKPDYPYEFEARPAGLGIYTEFFGGKEQVGRYFAGLSEYLGRPLGVQVLPSVFGGEGKKDRSLDSRTFAKNAGLPFFENGTRPNEEYLLWARGGEEDIEAVGSDRLSAIEAQSLTPVRDHGNKEYLARMGLATVLCDTAEIDFDTAFCIKPIYGSKSDGVGIFVPDGKKLPGTSTRTQILRLRDYNDAKGGSLVQEYIPPALVSEEGQKQQFMIFRIFAAFMPETGQYEMFGGTYFTRPNVKIHGASDALVGKVEIT